MMAYSLLIGLFVLSSLLKNYQPAARG